MPRGPMLSPLRPQILMTFLAEEREAWASPAGSGFALMNPLFDPAQQPTAAEVRNPCDA